MAGGWFVVDDGDGDCHIVVFDRLDWHDHPGHVGDHGWHALPSAKLFHGLLGVGGAVIGTGGHETCDPGAEPRGDVGGDLVKGDDFVIDVFVDDFGHGGAVEGFFAGQGFVKDAAEGIEVGAFIDGLASELLGRHVVDGAEDGAADVLGLFAGFESDACEAEVDDLGLHATAGEAFDFDVFGFDVAVENVALVSCQQAFQGLIGEFFEVVVREGAACDDVGEVLTFEQFHDDEEALLVAGDIEDGDNVGIAEAGEGIGFLAEFFLEIGTGVAGVLADGEALDGDPSFQLAVVGTENRANAAGTELFIDLVAICH